MNSVEQYLQTIKHIRSTILNLIEYEKKGQEPNKLTKEVDMLFEHVISLQGESADLYRCRLMMIEALEDFRISIESRRETPDSEDSLHGSYWQSKRASYLLKIQAAEEEIQALAE